MPSMIYLWALLAVPCAALDEYTKYPTGDTFVRSCNENGIYALADREDVLQVRKHSSEPAPPSVRFRDYFVSVELAVCLTRISRRDL